MRDYWELIELESKTTLLRKKLNRDLNVWTFFFSFTVDHIKLQSC